MSSGLILRPFTGADLFLLTELEHDPEVRYFDGDPVPGGWNLAAAQSNTYLVAELGEGELAQAIGVIVCQRLLDDPVIFSIGINLFAPFRNQGLGKLTLRRLLTWLFSEQQADRIELLVRDYNLRAIRCYQAVGFRQEGLRRACGRINGQLYGEILMSILRIEAGQYLQPLG
jgi:RimJ/RimL family protein N-acetyltransferase